MIRKLTLFLSLALALISPALADPVSTSVRVVVPVRDIARGDVISESDLTFGTVQGTGLMNGTVTSMATAIGMESRRVLRAGVTLSASDLRRPVVVNRGQTVTMTFAAPGVDLTAMGRAMGEGGVGDTVTVQNPASFRLVTAVVTAAGTVRATGPIANGAAFSSQITARK
jgi:flagella basal body P-ring formation protein FlgA